MNITAHTKPFAVLGHPIGHSLSPVMHNAAFYALGMDAVYLAFDVDPDWLMDMLTAMADMGFGGVNLTVPLKEVAFKGLPDLDESARMLGAVNTVEFLPGGMKGHNTDGKGFLLAVEEAFGVTVAGLSVFIIGSGGAGRAVAITCAVKGAERIALTDMVADRPQQAAAEISRLVPEAAVETIPADQRTWEKTCADTDLVVQTTPVGMKEDDESLLAPTAFHERHIVFDLVYMYPETAFMKAARQSGARAANGLGMLLHQGARALSIWTGHKAPVDVMRKALEEEVYGGSAAR